MFFPQITASKMREKQGMPFIISLENIFTISYNEFRHSHTQLWLIGSLFWTSTGHLGGILRQGWQNVPQRGTNQPFHEAERGKNERMSMRNEKGQDQIRFEKRDDDRWTSSPDKKLWQCSRAVMQVFCHQSRLSLCSWGLCMCLRVQARSQKTKLEACCLLNYYSVYMKCLNGTSNTLNVRWIFQM